MKFYEYKGCDTCRRAKKFLESRSLAFEAIPIREQPPTKAELNRMLAIYGGDLGRLFNTSGGDYKAMKLSKRLPTRGAWSCRGVWRTFAPNWIAWQPGKLPCGKSEKPLQKTNSSG